MSYVIQYMDSIDKARVVLLPDEHGVKHFQKYYTELSISASELHEDKVKLVFIRKLLKRLRLLDKRDLPTGIDSISFDFEIDVDGISYTRPLDIVKKLGKSVVYELRIDISDFNWYFRATFFPKYHQDELYYCVVYPFVKVPGEENPTDEFRDLTHNVFEDTRLYPDKYFN